jgi:hypothetical protein
MTAVAQYASVELPQLPRLDRFFPDCGLGLVELVAGVDYGFPDLKKIWFGNTFQYRPPADGQWLNANKVELAAHFSVAPGVPSRAVERLRKYYQVEVHTQAFAELDALLREVHRTLSRKLPAIASFDMSFLQEAGRRNGKLQPHMIGIVGWDVPGGKLRIVDQVRGELAIPFEQLELSFQRFVAQGEKFCVLRCERSSSGPSLPLERETIVEWLREAVGNRRSPDPHLGLNALARVAADVATAVEVEQKAFAIPGQWIISHDRHALRKQLPYWKEAQVADSARLEGIDRALAKAFTVWFEIDMTIERAIHDNDVVRMRKASRLLSEAVRLEDELTTLLERASERA